MTTVQIALPEKLKAVFSGRADVRGSYGGRGSGKTRSFAKMAAVQGYIHGTAGTSGIILCARQFMNSLEDSSLEEVKRAIEDEPWLKSYYDIGDKYIKSKDGRISFAFAGLDRNIASIKSKGRLLLCWIDEAEPVTDEAFLTLVPTLREEDSDWNAELWITWNPKRKSAAVESRYRNSKDPLVKIVECNFRDNPKFPLKLERDRQRDLEERPDQYDHVWEGAFVSTLVGAYFAKHITQAKADGRIGRVGADPLMTLRAFVDIGGTGRQADAFTLWVAQFIGKEIRVLDYYESVGQPLAAHLAWMRSKGYTHDKLTIWLPHDGNTQDKVFDVSYKSALTDAGYAVEVVPNQGKGAAMARVECARRMFPQMWFNEETTQPGLDAVGYYHEKRDDTRNIGLGPEHDWSSHGCLIAGSMVDTLNGKIAIEKVKAGDYVLTPSGYALVTNAGMTKVSTDLIDLETSDGHILTMTPEHKVFTTKGVVLADALGYNDSLFTKEIPPCLSYQKTLSMGYRGAFIESFKGQSIGFGKLAACMARKLAEFKGFCTLRFTGSSTESLRSGQRFSLSMATCATQTQITGYCSGQSALESIGFKSVMGSGSISSQRAITKQTTNDTEASQCTDMFGQSILATYQKECTFITKTETSPITPLEILNFFPQATIPRTTAQQTNGWVAKPTKTKLLGMASLLKHGIQALKVLHGIARTALRLGKTAFGTLLHVGNAGEITQHPIQHDQSIAVRIAKLKRYTAAVPVYDLTVYHHHCYFANGILVSNSDSFGLMAIVADAVGAGSPSSKPIVYKKRYLC